MSAKHRPPLDAGRETGNAYRKCEAPSGPAMSVIKRSKGVMAFRLRNRNAVLAHTLWAKILSQTTQPA